MRKINAKKCKNMNAKNAQMRGCVPPSHLVPLPHQPQPACFGNLHHHHQPYCFHHHRHIIILTSLNQLALVIFIVICFICINIIFIIICIICINIINIIFIIIFTNVIIICFNIIVILLLLFITIILKSLLC